MANNITRYKDLERILTVLLIVAALDFVLFLVSARPWADFTREM